MNKLSRHTVMQGRDRKVYFSNGPLRSMELQKSIGIIRLDDYDYPPALGDVDCPESYNYEVVYEIADSLTFERAQKGDMKEDIIRGLEKAVKNLEAKGVSGISGDCGFMMHYQKLLRNISKIPVFMSSLLQVPLAIASLSDEQKLAVMTANSSSLEPELATLMEMCASSGYLERLKIIGCQDVPVFGPALANGLAVDVEKATPGIQHEAENAVDCDPKIGAFLFECTELGPYSDSVRESTGRPVFDSITLINSFHSSVSKSSFSE